MMGINNRDWDPKTSVSYTYTRPPEDTRFCMFAAWVVASLKGLRPLPGIHNVPWYRVQTVLDGTKKWMQALNIEIPDLQDDE